MLAAECGRLLATSEVELAELTAWQDQLETEPQPARRPRWHLPAWRRPDPPAVRPGSRRPARPRHPPSRPDLGQRPGRLNTRETISLVSGLNFDDGYTWHVPDEDEAVDTMLTAAAGTISERDFITWVGEADHVRSGQIALAVVLG